MTALTTTDITRYWRSVAYTMRRINGGTFDITPATAQSEYPPISPQMAEYFRVAMEAMHVPKNYGEIKKAAVLVEYIFLLQQKELSDYLASADNRVNDMIGIITDPETSENEKFTKLITYLDEK